MDVKSKMSEERLPFFVYGTLLPGQPNAFLWEGAVIDQETAVFPNASLYDMGSYPMLIEEGGAPVYGLVNHVAEAEYDAVLARLDWLEDYDPAQPDLPGYRRVAREVQMENGRSLRVWVYAGQPAAVRGLKSIPGGDWAAYIAAALRDIEQMLGNPLDK